MERSYFFNQEKHIISADFSVTPHQVYIRLDLCLVIYEFSINRVVCVSDIIGFGMVQVEYKYFPSTGRGGLIAGTKFICSVMFTFFVLDTQVWMQKVDNIWKGFFLY
jgi:hypothetical protein